MKCISWNVNGIRACVKKGFLDHFHELNADIFAIQESKVQKDQIDLDLDGYYQYWNYAEKKGYSGTAVFTKEKPLSVVNGLGVKELDNEGRIITCEYDEFYFITLYTPNAQEKLARLDFRLEWEVCFRQYIHELDKKKPVILCGDLNVAHEEIDLKNPKPNRGKPGFSDEEREQFSRLLDTGYIDSFRHFYPNQEHAYTWWSYRFHARANNAGWRIDYFCVSQRIANAMHDAQIHAQIMGSDHCPVELLLNVSNLKDV